MKIGIDARELVNPHTGIGTYVQNLIRALGHIDQLNHYYLFVNKNYEIKLNLPDNFVYHRLSSSFFSKIRDQYEISRYISKNQFDVFHIVHHDTALIATNIPVVVTVHDIAWLDIKGRSRIFQKYYYYLTYFAMLSAKYIITVSESTKRRVEHYFPFTAPKIQTIRIACDISYEEELSSSCIEENIAIVSDYKLNTPYILYVGSFAERKNLLLLIKAMRIVYKKYPKVKLILAGRKSGRNDIAPEKLDEEFQIDIIDRLKTESELKTLYKNAEMLVFPSLYEGFGLPVLEAMTCGCPVIVSNTTSLPEIVEDSGILIDPYNEVELADQILNVLKKPALAKEMIEKGKAQSQKFDWMTVGKKTLEIYRSVYNRNGQL